MNVLIYTRVSTEEQAASGYSLDAQEDTCRDYCKKQGWNVIQVFREEGESAKTAARTQLIKLLEYCRKNKGKVDILLVYKLDRFSRNTSDHQTVRALLNSFGVALRSATEHIDDTSTGKLMENIFSAFAQWDNDTRAERTKLGMQQKVKEGFWAWKAPIGYLNSPMGLVIDAKNAPLIKRAFEMYSQSGYTIVEITDKMNQWGLRSTKGNKLTPQSVEHILRNKLYISVLEVRGLPDEVNGLHDPIVTQKYFIEPKLSEKERVLLQCRIWSKILIFR